METNSADENYKTDTFVWTYFVILALHLIVFQLFHYEYECK